MCKCGIENLTIEVIKECETQEQANNQERFWIRVLKCKTPNGYNQRNGGEVAYHKNSHIKFVPLPIPQNLNERVKYLRMEILKLNQTEFGVKIGLSQKAIANIETGATALTARNFEIICRTLNINSEWLRKGVSEGFIENKEFILKDIVEEFELTPDEAALIEALLGLPKEYRAGVVKYIKGLAMMFEENEKAAKQPELTEEEVAAIVEAEINEAAKAQNISLKEIDRQHKIPL